ncbi:uncharacterized protein METZ01_LOCUS124659, partial [marine metagenome]
VSAEHPQANQTAPEGQDFETVHERLKSQNNGIKKNCY